MISSLFSLAGRTALVTGGSRGIGQAMALGLAEAGADIILVLRSKSQTETQSKIENLGRRCFIHEADLGDAEAARNIVPAIVKEHRWFNILVNVAGIQRRSSAEDFPQRAYDEIMQVNLSATFRVCRDTGKYWLDNNIKGSIINTASIASFQGGVSMAAYATSKGGVAQLTKAFSNEWACKGIRVNAIAPGYIATDMNVDTRTAPDQVVYNSISGRIPMGRWGTPDDFKGPVVFLASNASSYVTGEILVVDGGYLGR